MLPATAEMVARLPQVKSPLCIALTNERVYVAEDSSQVHIFDRGPNGIAFKKTFGRQGDAPGELIEIYHLYPFKDHLEILTFGRFARFSPDGRFLDEQKFPLRVFKDGVFRIGEKFLARDFRFDDQDLSIAIRLYEKDFRNVQELVTHRMPLGNKPGLVTDYCSVRVVGDLAYVIESGKETKVMVYDQAGARQREFGLVLEPVQVSPALKEILLRPLKEEPGLARRGRGARTLFPIGRRALIILMSWTGNASPGPTIIAGIRWNSSSSTCRAGN